MAVADDIVAAQDRKFAALVNGDAAVLNDLLAAELVYTHANGKIDSRASLIESVRTRSYSGITRKTADVQIFGDVGVVTGSIHIAVHEALSFDGRFTDVWVNRSGWKNIAWQSTIIAAGV